MLPTLARSVPVWDAVLCACALPLVLVAWYATIVSGSHPHAVVASVVYTVVAAAVAFRRTHLLTSFAVTYLAFAVLVLSGSGTALGVFPLIVCVPLTICAVTTWAPSRWPGWAATATAAAASPLSPAVAITASKGWSIGAHVGIIAGCYLWASRRRIQRQARDRERDHDVRFAQLSERQRIAAELHDGLGHTLTAIRAKAATAEATSATHPDRAADALRVISELSRNSLIDLRRTLGELSQNGDDNRSHDVASIGDLLTRARHLGLALRCTLPAHTDVDAIDARLSSRSRAAVIPTIQEAITNIVRHNRPGVDVSIAFGIRRPFSPGETLLVRIENVLDTDEEPSNGNGLGVENMRRRMAALGGGCTAHRGDDTFVVEIEAPTLKGM